MEWVERGFSYCCLFRQEGDEILQLISDSSRGVEIKNVKNYHRAPFGKSGSEIYQAPQDRDAEVSADRPRKIPAEFSLGDPLVLSFFPEAFLLTKRETVPKHRAGDGVVCVGSAGTSRTAGSR